MYISQLQLPFTAFRAFSREGVGQRVLYHAIGQVCVFFSNCLSFYTSLFLFSSMPFCLFDDAGVQYSMSCLIPLYVRKRSKLLIEIAGASTSYRNLEKGLFEDRVQSYRVRVMGHNIQYVQSLSMETQHVCVNSIGVTEFCVEFGVAKYRKSFYQI